MKPTIGRIVYYKARGSADGVFPKTDRAAVVTDVRVLREQLDTPSDPSYLEGLYEIRACVMNPEGLFFTAWIPQGQEGGQWDWMPFQKDQVSRLAKENRAEVIGDIPMAN